MKITNKINKNIFRGYDIRGIADVDLLDDVVYTIGLGFGSKIQELGKTCCVIGHDNRISSPRIHKTLIKGITDTGVDIIDLGLTTTPMYYFACLHFKIDCGIMITASHNPKDENGFKFAFSFYQNAKGKEIEDFYHYIMEGNFKSGSGSVQKRCVKDAYFKAISDGLSFGDREVSVVLDPANGTTAILLEELYSKFPIKYKIINKESNGNFPNHHPDPSIEENLTEL